MTSHRRRSARGDHRCLECHFVCRRLVTRCLLLAGLILCLFLSTWLMEAPQLPQETRWVPEEGRSQRAIQETHRSITFREIVHEVISLLNMTREPAGEFAQLSTLDRSSTSKGEPNIREKEPSSLSNVSVIITLVKFTYGDEAVRHFLDILMFLPEEIVTDVMVVVDGFMEVKHQRFIENAVDCCDKCRIYFLNETIYKARSIVSSFAHEDILVFLDGRTRLTQNWLEPMVAKVVLEPKAVVSPRVLLTTKKADIVSLGAYKNEITWDLAIVRGVDPKTSRHFQNSDTHFIEQMGISKEVLVIRKSFFASFSALSLLSSGYGSEDAVLSLAVLNCGGRIHQSVRSTVYLVIPTFGSPSAAESDFFNPSFSKEMRKSQTYISTMTKIWMDRLSVQFSSCSVRTPSAQRKGKMSSSTSLSREGFGIKRTLTAKQCKIANFRSLSQGYQSKWKAPEKYSTLQGYIRSLDGMYAFGMPAPTFAPAGSSGENNGLSWDKFVLTRNSSLWLGPISVTNDNVMYEGKYCLTTSHDRNATKTLTFALCIRGKLSQRFIFRDRTIRPISETSQCVQAVDTSSTAGEAAVPVSLPLIIAACSDSRGSKHHHNFRGIREFKVDVEFHHNCIR